jgi:hypothetical protein
MYLYESPLVSRPYELNQLYELYELYKLYELSAS